ncbi:MAG: hypothetical protein II670_10675, partial [Alphaproteobacteria bacterium]|nr:hypothetical protein [Alphaproteobacteria bacterium]
MKKNIYKIILALSFVLPICHISYAQTDDDWRKMVNKNLAIVERKRQNGIKNVGEYISATVSLAYLYNNAQKYDSVVYYGVEADSLLRNNLSEILGAHINFLALIAQSFFYLEDYNQAASYQEDMISLEEYVISHGGKTVDGYVPRLSIIVDDYRVLASLTREIPDQEATKHALQQAIKLMEDNDVVDSCENAGYIYGQMSFIYFDSDSLDLAISYVEKEGSVYERWYGKKSEQHKKSLRLMRLLFNQKGDSAYEIKDYQSALINFSICDSIFKLMDDTTSEDYYSNVIEMGRCYENMGMDARALTLLEPIEPVLASLFGKESSIYIEVTSLLASLNSEIQQYEKSYSFRQREYNTSLNDTNVVTQALSQFKYASVLDRKGEVDSAILCLKGAINGLGDSSLESVMPYSRLLAIYAREGDTNKCDSIE